MDTSKENRIRYLMDRCLHQQETAEERAELESYYNDARYQESIGKGIVTSFHQEKDITDMPREQSETIFQAIRSIDQKVRREPVIKLHYWRWVSVAAVALLIFVPMLVNRIQYPLSKKDPIAVQLDTRNRNEDKSPVAFDDKEPARNKALLTLADGSVFTLEDIQPGEEVVNEGLRIEKTKEGVLVLDMEAGWSKNIPVRNLKHTVTTPRGGTYRVRLTDGTLVHLNSASRLTFSSSFGESERRVEFEGEGYFDVAKDTQRQFVVVSGKGKMRQEVRVYGTQFNLSAYPDDGQVVTTLVEGSIMVKDLSAGVEQFIRPNEEALLDHGGIQIMSADLNVNLAWKNNLFYFADEPIVSVMKQISRWYDIDITYVGEKPTRNMWGQISRNKKLSEMLEILQQTNELKFQQKGKEVLIMD